MEHVVQIIAAALGTLGFAFLFSVAPRHLPLFTLGGALSWTFYLIAWEQGASVFVSTLISAALICLWSEGMARLRKAPANIFLLTGIVPLLPGGALYYTMEAIVSKNMSQIVRKGAETGSIAVGIAVGIIIGSELFRLYLSIRSHRRRVMEEKMRSQKGN